MLVLTRSVGEAIVIDGTFVAIVAVIGHDSVDLGLSNVTDGPVGTVTLDSHSLTHIALGVRGIVVSMQPPKVRLGFEYPDNVTVNRQEYS